MQPCSDHSLPLLFTRSSELRTCGIVTRLHHCVVMRFSFISAPPRLVFSLTLPCHCAKEDRMKLWIHTKSSNVAPFPWVVKGCGRVCVLECNRNGGKKEKSSFIYLSYGFVFQNTAHSFHLVDSTIDHDSRPSLLHTKARDFCVFIKTPTEDSCKVGVFVLWTGNARSSIEHASTWGLQSVGLVQFCQRGWGLLCQGHYHGGQLLACYPKMPPWGSIMPALFGLV